MATKLNVNGRAVSTNADPDTPLLWVICGPLDGSRSHVLG
jgi:aerobic-type carbon monoxide dehydrogenase small subunit (CoxS/CutS family)